MNKSVLCFITIFLLVGLFSTVSASNRAEIKYLLTYGYKVLIEGSHPNDKKVSWACRLKRSFNYIAIVQNDGANYRIMPIPLGKRVEPICPKHIFKNAHRWMDRLQKAPY